MDPPLVSLPTLRIALAAQLAVQLAVQLAARPGVQQVNLV
jgi:hypothetical protein